MTKNNSSIIYKAAKLISVLGHPLLISPVFIIFLAVSVSDNRKAVWTSFFIIGGVVAPVAIRNYIKTRKGHYTNFDVSDQRQRQSFYPFLILLLTIVTTILFVTDQSERISYGSLLALLMIITAAIINRSIKCSLHTSASVYLALSIAPLSITGGILMFMFSILISFSRLILGRHTLTEILTGALTGFIFGAGNYYVQSRYML